MALFGRTKQQALAAIAHNKDRKGRRKATGAPNPVSNIVNLTQAQSPYTLQASDAGKTLAPATTAEFSIIHPSTLPAGFTCQITPTGNYPVSFSEGSGAQVTNKSIRISAVSKMANSIVMPGNTATTTATATGVYTLTGTLGQWRNCVGAITGLNAGVGAGVAYNFSFRIGEVRIPAGKRVIGLKFEYAHMYGNAGVETIPTYNADIGMSVEFPVESAPRPVLFGGVDQITLTPAANIAKSDYFLLGGTGAVNGDKIGIHVGQHTGSAGGCLAGSGSGLASVGEIYNYSATDGTTWKTSLAVKGSTLGNGIVAANTFISPSTLSPSAIIGVLDDGAEVVIMFTTSRTQPSNGDFQSVQAGYAGELGRLLGVDYSTMNAGIASSTIFYLNNTQGAYRRSLLQYATVAAMDGIVNDTSGFTLAQIESKVQTFKALSEMSNKQLWFQTTTPNISSTDHGTSYAGQSAWVLANSQNIDAFNTKLVNRQYSAFIDKVMDARSLVQSPAMLADGTYGVRIATNARVVTDAAVSIGSNLLASEDADFTTDDSGKYIYLSGSNINRRAVMTYVSPTQVSLKTYVTGDPWNATSTVTGMTASIQCDEVLGDFGTNYIHQTKRSGEYCQANRAGAMPTA